MGMLTHLSINLFPTIMLIEIYLSDHKKEQRSLDRRLFGILMLLTIALMVMDTLAFGVEGSSIRALLWIFQMLYVLLAVLVGSVWFMYVCCRLYYVRDKERMHRIFLYIRIGLLVYLVYVMTLPITKLAFSFTEEGLYQRKGGYFITYMLCIALLIWSVAEAYRVYDRDFYQETRTECLYLMGFCVIPIAGVLIQWRWDEWWIAGPSVAVAILYIYVNTRNRLITTDGLTGLNNRGEFDTYASKMAELPSEARWGLLMIDIDDFKKINDTLGHTVGDEALWSTADILRATLGREQIFLARYGGDEFAIIGEWRDDVEARGVISRIERGVRNFNDDAKKPYRLSLSIGYCMWSETKNSIEEMIEVADARMYEEKAKRKANMVLNRV